jgi:hypothetical protein
MPKQTSIEWLIEQLKQYDFSEDDGMYFIKIPNWLLKEKEKQAKQMHKEEIKEAAISQGNITGEQYYQETYGGNNE